MRHHAYTLALILTLVLMLDLTPTPLLAAGEGTDDIDEVSSFGNEDYPAGEEVGSVSPALQQQGDLEEAIPGVPGQDYPVYSHIPPTSFHCRGRLVPGYYADEEARCQVFHICDSGGAKHSFLCPSGSVFNQKYLVCDWWYTAGCGDHDNVLIQDIRDLGRIGRQGEHSNSEGILLEPVEEHNYLFLPTDIFHGAETGVPNREKVDGGDKNQRVPDENIQHHRESNIHFSVYKNVKN